MMNWQAAKASPRWAEVTATSTICQTAIDLAHRFGSVAVAEGIESMADLQALQVMRCDYGQGILLAPPMPKGRFIELLNSRNNKTRASEPVSELRQGRVA